MIQLLLIFMRESAIDSSSLVGDGAFDLSSFLFCDARMASVSISVSSHLSHSHRATYLEDLDVYVLVRNWDRTGTHFELSFEKICFNPIPYGVSGLHACHHRHLLFILKCFLYRWSYFNIYIVPYGMSLVVLVLFVCKHTARTRYTPAKKSLHQHYVHRPASHKFSAIA